MGKAALAIIGGIFGVLPRRLQLLLGGALGLLLRGIGFRKKVIQQNLEFAFRGEERAFLRKQTLRDAYNNLGIIVLELLVLFGGFRKFVEKNSTLKGMEHWRAATAKGKGVIFLASHVGNWEVMTGAGALGGMDLIMVTKHLKPEWLHLAIEKSRKSCGTDATYEPKTFRDILKRLARGGTVGMVLDQYAGPPVGIRVPFFGVPVGTHSVVAMLVKRTGAAVIPVVNYRDSAGHYWVDMSPELKWIECEDADEELAINTANFTQVIESHVFAHSDQWLWTHRRFKGDLSELKENEWRKGRLRKG